MTKGIRLKWIKYISHDSLVSKHDSLISKDTYKYDDKDHKIECDHYNLNPPTDGTLSKNIFTSMMTKGILLW